jgi:2-methylisocitrate lyase-like PEP mutase family enzyme
MVRVSPTSSPVDVLVDAPMTVAVRNRQPRGRPAGRIGRMSEAVNERARLLRALHEPSAGVLVLPNAWDAASAAMVADAGASAVATTSGGVAWSRGRPDGEGLDRDAMVAAVARIATAVEVPVTADVEGGYGDVAATVAAVAAAGAAGVNLEDSRRPGGPLFTAAEQAERIRAARAAAARAGVPNLVVNARTDVVLFGLGDLDEVRARSRAYREAGADCLFVPGLLDLDALGSLARTTGLPVNAMAVPGGPTVGDLAAAGVRRVSVGTAIAQAAYALAGAAAAELLATGTYAALSSSIGYPEMNAAMRRSPAAA